MGVELGALSLFFGPRELQAADDLESIIVDFIDDAEESLSIAIQELESEPICDAILRARARRKRSNQHHRISVRIVLEGDYLCSNRIAADPSRPGGAYEANRTLFNRLMRGAIDAKLDYNPKIFHQKFIVRDPDHRRAALLSGSTNFTPTGVSANFNHIAIFKGKRITSVYADEFEEIWSGTFGTNQQRHDEAPVTATVSKVPVKVLFAPDHAPEMEIMKQMMRARSRIDFAIFTFAESSGIDDTMIALQRAGISVRGVLDENQANQRWAATHGLAHAGVELHACPHTHNVNKLHHKLMVIDGQVVIGGSFNYTEPANRLNDENIFVIGDLSETDPERIDRQRQIAGFALAEIDRIIREFGVPLTV